VAQLANAARPTAREGPPGFMRDGSAEDDYLDALVTSVGETLDAQRVAGGHREHPRDVRDVHVAVHYRLAALEGPRHLDEGAHQHVRGARVAPATQGATAALDRTRSGSCWARAAGASEKARSRAPRTAAARGHASVKI